MIESFDHDRFESFNHDRKFFCLDPKFVTPRLRACSVTRGGRPARPQTSVRSHRLRRGGRDLTVLPRPEIRESRIVTSPISSLFGDEMRAASATSDLRQQTADISCREGSSSPARPPRLSALWGSGEFSPPSQQEVRRSGQTERQRAGMEGGGGPGGGVVVVTGASGRLGRAAVLALCGAGWGVRGADAAEAGARFEAAAAAAAAGGGGGAGARAAAGGAGCGRAR